MTGQVVPPSISRAKFEREVEAFRNLEASHRQNGRILLRAEFPVVEVLFLARTNLHPMALYAVRVDFTNYDVDPPSVRFIDVFTGRVLNFEEVREHLWRLDPSAPPELVALAREGVAPPPRASMIQGYVGQPAFLCMPGTREYHENPGHSGNPWLLHRSGGEGRLHHLVTTIARYGTEPVTGGLEVQFQGISIQLQRREVPA